MIWMPLGPDGAWFISGCHGDDESGASAAAGAELLRGGMGVSRGSDCALAKLRRGSTQADKIASRVKAQMFLHFMFPPSHSLGFRQKEFVGTVNWRTTSFGEHHPRGSVRNQRNQHRKIVK